MALQIKDVEYLGIDGMVQWYWDPVGQKYYQSYMNAGWNSSTLYEVTNESDLKKLEVEYPRGDNAFDDSAYTPTLEIKSYNDYGAAVDATGTSLRFPNDMLIDEGEDFVMFDLYDYRPPFNDKGYGGEGKEVLNQTLSQYNASGYANEYFKDKKYKQILLYMPQDVTDTFAAKWEGKKFGALSTGVISAAGSGSRDKKLENVVKAATEAFDRGGANAAAEICLLYTSPSPRDKRQSRMPSSA